MIRKFLAFVIIALTFAACQSGPKSEFNGALKIEPAHPKQGENVKIIYDDSKTELKGSKEVTATVYQFNWEIQDARDVQMKKENNVWTAEIPVAKDVCGLIMSFSNGTKKDNFNKKGYVVQVYDKDGNKVKGLKAGLAVAYTGWINNLGIDPDRTKAYEMFKEAFAEEPSVKRAYITKYLPVLMREEKENPQQKLGEELKKVTQYKNLTEDELSVLVDMYSALRDTKNFDKYQQESISKFPKGVVAQRVDYRKIVNNPTIENIKKFKEKYPESKYIEGLTYNALRNYVTTKNFKKALNFCEKLKEDIHPYYFGYVVGKMLDADADMKVALKIAELGIERGKEVASEPDSAKPKEMTLKDWHEMNNYYLGRNYSEYAKVLNRLGKKTEALKATEKAMDLIPQDYLDPQMVKLYAKLLVEEKQFAKAKDFIEKSVKAGTADAEMKDLLKKAYVKLNKNAGGFQAYLASLENAANKKIVEELKDEMINEPAPDFTLKDLDGKEVKLSDLKGKVVIVDFWATWCNPCLNSFPGMKKLVEQYKNDKEVEFLFVNTWERVDNKVANAKNFVKQNNYPFHVLIDSENKVVASFKVSGIPTKFIIGKNGNIRFKSVGFDGSTEKLVKEVSAMISMIK